MHRSYAVRTEHHLVEHLACVDGDPDRPVVGDCHTAHTHLRVISTPTGRDPAALSVSFPARDPSAATRIAASTHPAPRMSEETIGPATSTTSTEHDGAYERNASVHLERSSDPGVHPTRTTPERVGSQPCGDGRSLRAHPHYVLATHEDPHRPAVLGSKHPRRLGHRRIPLPAESTTVRYRRRRLSPRLTPRRVRLQVGRFHEGGA